MYAQSLDGIGFAVNFHNKMGLPILIGGSHCNKKIRQPMFNVYVITYLINII